MSIVGVGADLVEIDRFRPERVSSRLLQRVFTDAERAYCAGHRAPWMHLAARFAAKEAAVKALTSVLPGLMVSQIEVVSVPDGSPTLRLVSGLRSPQPPALPRRIVLHCSLSHAGAYASATVVAERVEAE
ncbi:MAG: holo-ACP synthase [Capsulimonadaceae bacterium]|nr:holo-ACP synthase [Capsulimonadaceae bacterium]